MRTVSNPWTAALALWVCAGAVWACDCTAALEQDGWCGACKVGFVAGMPVKNEKLHKTLRGYPMSEADAAKSPCSGCKEAYAKDGACSACNVQFVRHTAYLSPSAAKLAAGYTVSELAPHCEKSRALAASKSPAELAKMIAWRDSDGMGVVAGHVFADQESFAAARQAYSVISKAISAADKCEGCAIALARDGACRACGVSFKEGQMARVDAKP